MVGTVGILILTESPPASNLHGDSAIFPLIVNVPVSTSAANTPALIKKEEKTAAAIIERFIICSLIKFIFGC